MADKNLNLYRGMVASPPSQTWVSLFTTNPTADHPTAHGGVEWGPARVRVYPDSGSGFPYWGAPSDLSPTVRQIVVQGSIGWSAITLTVTPSTVVGVGVFEAVSGGDLLDWWPLTTTVVVADGESHSFGTGFFRKEHD